ncbi:MAG TPA: hypothetical protein VFQ42_22510 [Mycobacterium sp.]|nr:hypothetical protein [Mycobacterium sp.]
MNDADAKLAALASEVSTLADAYSETDDERDSREIADRIADKYTAAIALVPTDDVRRLYLVSAHRVWADRAAAE